MSTQSILLVEDDSLSARLFQRIFHKAGLSNPLYVVNNGEQAISYLAGDDEYADRVCFPIPSLIFLDLYMPGKSGHEVLAWIRSRQEFEVLPVVVLTSSRESSDIETAYELGANSYLVKPMSPESIKEMVEIFAKPIQHNPRILLLDDDSDMRLLAINQLKREFPGAQIVEVGLPEELSTALEQQEYDLVITDYEMQWTNGLKILRVVKARWPRCPVIMFTGSGSEEIAVEAMRAGLDDYVLKKPRHFARLSGAARLALARSRHLKAARDAEQRYRSLFDSVPVGLFRCDFDGRLTDANTAFIKMLGFSDMQAALGLDLKELFVDKSDYSSLLDGTQCEQDAYNLEARISCNDGSVIWGEIRIHAVCDEQNNPLYYDGIFQDISQRKHLESQLRQALKMEAIGTLAGGIAHDFNNILTSLMGYASLMQIKLEESNPLRIYVDQILSASQKAADLTQNLLSFSRQQPVKLTPVDINNAIRNTNKLLRRLLSEDIELIISFSREDAVVMADKSQIDQILFNLVSNARDAMPKGGKLILKTDIVYLDKDFIRHYGFGKPGKYISISVTDTGIGMDETTREKIFDPFFTTKEVGKGTGLGLATVYGIVKQHNGYITVDSAPNVGATFTIFIPIIKMTVERLQKNVPQITKGNETILIAEDNAEVRQFMMEALRQCGYKTIEAVDGEDAINKFNHGQNIELIILDSVMPKKNGREVYENIRKINSNIKVLFTSGYTDDIILEKEVEHNALNFIAKPMSLNMFIQKVRDVLDN